MEEKKEEKEAERKNKREKCKCSYPCTAYNPNMYLFLIRSRR